MLKRRDCEAVHGTNSSKEKDFGRHVGTGKDVCECVLCCYAQQASARDIGEETTKRHNNFPTKGFNG